MCNNLASSACPQGSLRASWPGSLATLYASARTLDGAFFLVSPGPDHRLQPLTPPLRLLRPRAAARPLRPRSPAVCRRRSRVLSP
uniref:Uncharacterized protein n=1 Tax=Oryza rufipogon TaxID=4529 RepID=A0A0E0Q4Q5_ORYRU